MSVGKKIKELRLSKHITQEELALSICSTKQTIYKYEKEIITNIPFDKLVKIAHALDTTPAYLMGWDKAPTPDIKKGNSEIASLVIRLRTDRLFLEAVKKIDKLEPEKIKSLLALL